MLAANTTPYVLPAIPHHNFLPRVPSPLSPRSANIYGRLPPSTSPQFTFMSDDKKQTLTAPKIPQQQQQQQQQQGVVEFSRRAVKKAPSPKQDELKEKRRRLFLKKVQDGREERRFEGRSDDIMRLDFVQRRKQWEAELAREAPRLSLDGLDGGEVEEQEQEDDLPGWNDDMQISAPSTQQPWLEDEADEAIQRENAELEALLCYMSADQQIDDDKAENVEHLYSDDDDYDALFSELMEQGEFQVSNPTTASRPEQPQGEAMDTS